MKRASKGYSGVDILLFPTMLTTPESSPSKMTSSPSLSPQTHPSTSQPPSTPQSNQTTPVTEEATLMPHESPLQSVYLLGRDEGSLSLNELTNLCTSLSKKVESLESELKQTKQTYHVALTKLIKRVKKLEQTIKISQAKRRAKVVISDAEENKEDPSKQGRSLTEELDLDARISLVPPHAADQGRIDDTHISAAIALANANAARRRQSVENVQTYIIRRRESIVSRLVSTADVSTASELGSTAGVKAKDKGKAIMQESELPKKIKKRVQVQMSVDEELAKNLDEREEVVAQAHDIDWNDPAVLRCHTFQNRPFSVAEVRKNMYIRPIFERVWDQNQAFVPKDSEIEKEVMKRSGFDLQQESLEDDTEKEELQVYLNIVPEDESLDVESLATKYPIVDWETQILANDKYYYQIKRADGSVKHYKLFSAMLYDFDRQDTLIEPNEEDEIWRNQQDWNLINWKLHNFCGVHVLLMDTGFVIHMMVEKKYPLSQDILSKMLSRKLEVDHQSDMGYELIRRNLRFEEVMEFESALSNTTAKIPILKLAIEVVMTKERISAALVIGACRVDKGSAAHDVSNYEVNFQMQGRVSLFQRSAALGLRSCSSDSSGLVEAVIKPGDVGIIAGIPQQHLRRKVLIYSPARTASQQGSGKVGRWKINFLSNQK
ncbi:hypothetical protein Tco_0400450 [Tanacetum coccineum]